MSDRDEPLADLAADVRKRQQERDDRDDSFDELDGDMDSDRLWSEVEAIENEVETLSRGQSDVHVVDKSMCHGCEYFATPPTVACEHDGTEIEALVEVDQFRVVDCPVVERERELEQRS